MLIVGGGLVAAAIAIFLLWRLIARVRALSAVVVELMTLDGARKQYVAQLRQLDRQALAKEFEGIRQLLEDLMPRT